MSQFINEKEIRKAISIIKADSVTNVFEVRIIRNNRKLPIIGYFKDVDVLIEKLNRQDLRDTNVYIVLNEIHEECYGRIARDDFKQADHGTKDQEIIGRWWVLVDLDPKRPSGTSSSDEKVKLAERKAKAVLDFLKSQGFNDPVIGFSGNGYHLLYKICAKNTEKNNETIKRFLNTLDVLFSDDDVKIDTANFNASRVCKLYGTVAQKGSNSEEYPHRMSYVRYVPKEVTVTPMEYFEKVNNIIPKEPDRPQRYNNYNGQEFDLDEWLRKYGIAFRKASASDGTKYILEHCPFDHSHTGKDAMIFRGNNGAIGFHCFHDSCQGKTWKDVRVMFEPDAYERKWQQQDKRIYGHYNRNEPIQEKELVGTEENPIWYTPVDVFNLPVKEVHYIKTGYTEIDKKLYGLKKKGISVLTGLRSAGKSTWIDGLILNAIQCGNIVGCYSGELDEYDFMRWLIRQAAGKRGVEPGRFEGQYNVPRGRAKVISEWMQGKFFLYNNHHGNQFKPIYKEIEKKIDADKLDLVIIDNLMALDIDDYSQQKLDAQKEFVLSLKRLAVQKNVHVMFVAHPRKTVTFLRLEDISGSGDLANAVDLALLLHRNNEDFKLRSKEMFKWKDDHIAYSGTNVIEIAKDRESGTQDWFVPLWYEPETKRLKNQLAENIIYGWDINKYDGFEDVPEGENPFV